MTGTVRRILHRSKDAALGAAARSFVNSRLHGIGKLTDLEIDTANATVSCRLQLVGEHKPIDIEVGRYRVKRSANRATITVDEVTSSRQWLTAALQSFVVGRRFQIPPLAAASLASPTDR